MTDELDEQELLPTPDDIEDRRCRVREMLLRGIRVGTMAKILGVTRDTIRSDTNAIKDALREKYKNLDIKTTLGECADALEMLAKKAALEAEKTKNKKMRNAFLGTSVRAWVAKAHVLSDPGTIPTAIGGFARVAVTKLDEGDYDHKVSQVLKDANSRKKLVGVLGQLIRASRPKATIDIKPAEGVVVSPSPAPPVTLVPIPEEDEEDDGN